jgi:hypothetical protein
VFMSLSLHLLQPSIFYIYIYIYIYIYKPSNSTNGTYNYGMVIVTLVSSQISKKLEGCIKMNRSETS